MDFDFNLILVPITLILGMIWLLDKLWWRRQRQSDKRVDSGISKSEEAGDAILHAKQDAYEQTLARHQITYETLDTAVVTDAPQEVKEAQREYREAKRLTHLNSSGNTLSGQPNPHANHAPMLVRWANDYFPVLAIVLIVRSFIIEPFNIPSSSMVPALYTGDFVAVNKYAYGIRLPLSYTKVLDTGQPNRGDVVVFRYPENPKIYYIKRVIGLPGDIVSFNNGKLSINANQVSTQQVNFNADDTLIAQLYSPYKNGSGEWELSPEKAVQIAQIEESGAKYYQEKLGEHTYLRRYLAPSLQQNQYSSFLGTQVNHKDTWEVQVPDGKYFVMGDNSDRSEDGRFWGFVPDENLAGKAFYVWMHKKPGLTNMPTFTYNRLID